ncbi:MAG: hypothetical protein PHN56_03960, partial [Candidatus Nanoarchaeia archaeon]|nr:hypothetical protein [Candidatus Nanoarchaeia archaeon]
MTPTPAGSDVLVSGANNYTGFYKPGSTILNFIKWKNGNADSVPYHPNNSEYSMFHPSNEGFRIYSVIDSNLNSLDKAKEIANRHTQTEYSCCGDDVINDNFYNNLIGSSTNFCYQGNEIKQSIEDNNILCNYYNYTWLPNSSFSAAYDFTEDKTELDAVDYKGDYADNWGTSGVPIGWSKYNSGDNLTVISFNSYHTYPIKLTPINDAYWEGFKRTITNDNTWISFWFKVPTLDIGGFYLCITDTNLGNIISGFYIRPDGAIYSYPSATLVSVAGVRNTTEWHHYAINYSRNGMTYFYYDGALIRNEVSADKDPNRFIGAVGDKGGIGNIYFDSFYVGTSQAKAFASLGSKERIPANWSFQDNNNYNLSYMQTFSNISGHFNVLKHISFSTSTTNTISYRPITSFTSGKTEFWFLVPSTNVTRYILNKLNGAFYYGIRIRSDGNLETFAYEGGFVYENPLSYEANTWYHVKIDRIADNNIKFYLNGVLWGTMDGLTRTAAVNQFVVETTTASDYVYIDAIDYSWSENYYDGRNNINKCCGDDGDFDTFYNGTIGNTANFCEAGNYLNQEIDTASNLCNYYNYTWLSGASN